MEYGAIDLHKRRSQIQIVSVDGAVVLARRIDTRREQFAAVFGTRPAMRVLIESSTESEWVAQLLEGWGHEVIVADPNYAAMYGTRARRVKTDARDAAALAEACRMGVYRRAHRASAETRTLRRTLQMRRLLVRHRTSAIALLRAFVRQHGLRVASGSADTFLQRLDRVPVADAVTATWAPFRTVLQRVTAAIDELDAALHARAMADPVTQHLMSAPGVGPVVALSFQAALETPARFPGGAAAASAFVGLVPREQSSGERRHKGAITKTGPRELRALLVQASWVIWRRTHADAAALRAWAHALAHRRGRYVAITALARRLARILFALWRDGAEFTPRRVAVA